MILNEKSIGQRLGILREMDEDTTAVCCVRQEVKELHNLHHGGVDRMLYLIRKVNIYVTRDFKR